MSLQTLQLTPDLYAYYQRHAFNEPELFAALRLRTIKEKGSLAEMQISPEQGQFMHWLVKASKTKQILEIGTFLGYSSLWLATALPPDGKLITCDINQETALIAVEYWKKAKVDHLIEFKAGPAVESLKALVKNTARFDFIFIDADKLEYDTYYEYALKLIPAGGIIAIDNTLKKGTVADPSDQQSSTVAMRKFNDKLIQDERVLISMIPISDGLTLVYKK